MADVYDFFSKKKLVEEREKRENVPKGYLARTKNCLQNMKDNGYCDCRICVDKAILAEKLYNIATYICVDYSDNTGRELYVADCLEILLTAAGRMKKEIYNRT